MVLLNIHHLPEALYVLSLFCCLILFLAYPSGRVARQRQPGWCKGAPCAADPLQQEEESDQ